jgi:hypothetical protein
VHPPTHVGLTHESRVDVSAERRGLASECDAAGFGEDAESRLWQRQRIHTSHTLCITHADIPWPALIRQHRSYLLSQLAPQLTPISQYLQWHVSASRPCQSGSVRPRSHVQTPRGDEGDVNRRSPGAPEGMHHLPAVLGVRRELLKRLDLGGKLRGRAGRAVFHANEGLAERFQRLGPAGEWETGGLVEVGAATFRSGVLRSSACSKCCIAADIAQMGEYTSLALTHSQADQGTGCRSPQ